MRWRTRGSKIWIAIGDEWEIYDLKVSSRELRLSGGAAADAGTITGLAAVFNSLSEDLGGWREIILPGAFTRALRERQDVVAIVNHDANLLLGRVANGSLVLAQDTGSAIVGAVRADYFVGWGPEAGEIAGRLKQPLRMWVLWPR